MAAKAKKKEETADEVMNRRIAGVTGSGPMFYDQSGRPMAGGSAAKTSKSEAKTEGTPVARVAMGSGPMFYDQSGRPMAGGSAAKTIEPAPPADITAGAPKALIVPEQADLTEKAAALFRHTHGGPFDPKSSMDKKKMAAIQSLLSQEGSDKLTPNQFALRIYRTTK